MDKKSGEKRDEISEGTHILKAIEELRLAKAENPVLAERLDKFIEALNTVPLPDDRNIILFPPPKRMASYLP